MPTENMNELQDHIDSIPGFLFPCAAHGTAWLLGEQLRRGYRGGVVEIGVFHGKYFVVLCRSAQTSGDVALAIDCFVYSSEADFGRTLTSSQWTTSARVELLNRRSTEVSAAEIRAILGTEARFVSVDGSHDEEDVFYDLNLADAIIGSCGIVAIDDFLNPRALGVGQATHRFLSGKPDLAPFALFGNKLFVCRPAARHGYSAAVRSFFQQSALPEGIAFRDLEKLGPEHVEQSLHGAKLLVM